MKQSILANLRLWWNNGRFWRRQRDNVPARSRFADAATHTINSLANARAKSTIDNYRTALRSFLTYAGADLLTTDISAPLMEGYQHWLQERGVSLNSISCYMRSLRSLFYRIMPDAPERALFKAVFTGHALTDKRAIKAEDIVGLQRLHLPEGSRLCFARDLFIFSFSALGMPFVDVAHLRKTQIVNGYITYYRHKTGQRIRVKVEPIMWQVIRKYTQPDSPYVFPILSATDRAAISVQYETARNRYNRHLKHLAALSGVQRILTSYVARHSWASMAYHSNVDLPVISKALGHTSPTTTLTYIREIDDDRIDAANQQLVACIV